MELASENYRKYRGKCKEMCEEWLLKYPELILVRGHYICPHWGKQAHWWLKDDDGIIDPTVKQFPTAGIGAEYIEFDGYCSCDECGKTFHEDDKEATFASNYALCSGRCYMRFVGIN